MSHNKQNQHKIHQFTLDVHVHLTAENMYTMCTTHYKYRSAHTTLIKAGSKFKNGDKADDDEETATNKQTLSVMDSQ